MLQIINCESFSCQVKMKNIKDYIKETVRTTLPADACAGKASSSSPATDPELDTKQKTQNYFSTQSQKHAV